MLPSPHSNAPPASTPATFQLPGPLWLLGAPWKPSMLARSQATWAALITQRTAAVSVRTYWESLGSAEATGAGRTATAMAAERVEARNIFVLEDSSAGRRSRRGDGQSMRAPHIV